MKWYFCAKCDEWYNEEEAEKFSMTCQDCDGGLIATCHNCMKPEKLCKCKKE